MASLVAGLRRASAQPRLALMLWLVNLVLALVAAGPAASTLHALLADAPAGDRLLEGFSFGIAADLLKAEPGRFRLLFALVIVAAVLALLANTATTGGVLDVLTTDDRRRFLHRFGRGAGRFFGRFLRAGLAAGLVVAAGAAVATAALRLLKRRLEDSPWEPMPFALGLAWLVLVAGLAVLVLLALDVGRIGIVREDGRSALRACWTGLRFVLRHPFAVLGIWAGCACLFGVVLAAYLGVRSTVPAASALGIALMVVAQQLVMLARAGLRVALFGGLLDALDRQRDTVAAAQTQAGDLLI